MKEKFKKLFINKTIRDTIFGFGLVMLPFVVALIVAALSGCAYKPDHRTYPQTQYGNIVCDNPK